MTTFPSLWLFALIWKSDAVMCMKWWDEAGNELLTQSFKPLCTFFVAFELISHLGKKLNIQLGFWCNRPKRTCMVSASDNCVLSPLPMSDSMIEGTIAHFCVSRVVLSDNVEWSIANATIDLFWQLFLCHRKCQNVKNSLWLLFVKEHNFCIKWQIDQVVWLCHQLRPGQWCKFDIQMKRRKHAHESLSLTGTVGICRWHWQSTAQLWFWFCGRISHLVHALNLPSNWMFSSLCVWFGLQDNRHVHLTEIISEAHDWWAWFCSPARMTPPQSWCSVGHIGLSTPAFFQWCCHATNRSQSELTNSWKNHLPDCDSDLVTVWKTLVLCFLWTTRQWADELQQMQFDNDVMNCLMLGAAAVFCTTFEFQNKQRFNFDHWTGHEPTPHCRAFKFQWLLTVSETTAVAAS